MGKDESAKYIIDFPGADVAVAEKPKPAEPEPEPDTPSCSSSTCHNHNGSTSNTCTGGNRIGHTIQEFRKSLHIARTNSRGESNRSPNGAKKRFSLSKKQLEQKEDDEKKKRMGSIRFYYNNHPSSGNIAAKMNKADNGKSPRRTLSLGNRILMQKNPKKDDSTRSLSPKKTSNAAWGHIKKPDKKPLRSRSMGDHKPYDPMELYSNGANNTQPPSSNSNDDNLNGNDSICSKFGNFKDDSESSASTTAAATTTTTCKEESPRSVMDAPCKRHSAPVSGFAKLPPQETWNCEFCTFSNEPMHLVCEMCGQAKKGSNDNASANGSNFESDGSAGSNFSEEEKTEFYQYQEALSEIRPSFHVGDRWIFDYDGCEVYLQAGERKDVRWMDIFMQVNIAPQDMLKATKHLLKLNAEMAMASPIPVWFAMDEDENILFVNRMNWERLPTTLLDEHIVRCIERMTVALLAEGIFVSCDKSANA